jgi:hypothetical protein
MPALDHRQPVWSAPGISKSTLVAGGHQRCLKRLGDRLQHGGVGGPVDEQEGDGGGAGVMCGSSCLPSVEAK